MKRTLALAAAGALALAPLTAAAAQPQILPSNPFTVNQANGPNYYVGTVGGSQAAGTAVTQRQSGNASLLNFNFTSNDGSNAAGYLQFNNGNYLAANGVCNAATVKSSASGTGIVWTLVPDGSGWKLKNRYCSQVGPDNITVYLEGDGTNGDQWEIGNNAGYFIKVNFHG